jgi:hypothetical protein
MLEGRVLHETLVVGLDAGTHRQPQSFPLRQEPLLLLVFLQQMAAGFLIMPGEIEGDREHAEQESVTPNTNNNASPSLTHSRLLPLRQQSLLL